ncbi:hypothetical protein JCM8115_005996 [Rhodotorula mucilaginosa]|uniref:Protein YOP1 n=1 Tax=Rhodotorula mucilaginosa TaxID=5537 RepID=A0A9P6W6B4_RHOMI|nr:ER membrane protein DP1/Yop1 [Rhodotorula mucilaginosa]TKA53663.1 hypothetical protein B0A53_03705 [Rhodotorula sp. CCFEE 5036]
MATAQQKFEYYVAQIDKELSKYPTLNRLEAQTSIPKAYAVLGVGAVFTFAIWFNIAAGFLSNFLGFALPAYFSLKALETPGHEDDIQWITYWIVFSSFSFVESFSRVLVAWFPYYYVFKTVFILYLILPSTRGAIVIHDKLFKPVFNQRKTPATTTTTTSSSTTPVAAAQ